MPRSSTDDSFVWDLKYPGPEALDLSLAPPRNTPLAEPPDPPSGPTVVPDRYRVEMSVGSQTMTAEFQVVKDPRLSTAPEAYRQQFELLRELTASFGKLNATVNNIRRLKHRLSVLAGGSDGAAHDLAAGRRPPPNSWRQSKPFWWTSIANRVATCCAIPQG